jgi:pectate lyase
MDDVVPTDPRPSGQNVVLSMCLLTAFIIIATGGCGPSRLFPIRAWDASVIDAPVSDIAPKDVTADDPGVKDIPMDVPAPDLPAADMLSDVRPDVGVLTSCPPGVLVGYGSTGAGTTGGGFGQPMTVTTLKELMDAMADDNPRVINVSGTITFSDQVRPSSNKTIQGAGPGAKLLGGGLYLKGVHNVIVRNLEISKATKTDAITIESSTNVWVDHCDLSSSLVEDKGTYDGLIDIVHASDWIEVSWTKFHDHYNCGLIGGSTNTAAEDTNHLTVTYHHNWFTNVESNTPRVRFGTVHVFNNLFEDVAGNAIASVMSAQVLIEWNVFWNVKYPIKTMYEKDPDPGSVNERNNEFDSLSAKESGLIASTWVPPYTVAPDPTSRVPLLVKNCTGPQF